MGRTWPRARHPGYTHYTLVCVVTILVLLRRVIILPSTTRGGWDPLNVQQFIGEILALLLDSLVVLFQVLVDVGQEWGGGGEIEGWRAV